MNHRPIVIILTCILLPLALASQARAQGASVLTGLVEGTTGAISDNLTGYALTAIGLNSQATTQTAILSELSQVNDELDTISNQLTEIQDAIETQTCVDALSSSAVIDALTSIATVSNTYTNLLEAGENPNGTVSQANYNSFLNQVNNGPGGGLPSISAALSAINIALQSTDNDGIIGACERAVTRVPATGSFGGDATFYADPVSLLQYFADYQTVAALLLAECYNYEAFRNSPYYAATGTGGLPANEAALVCANPTGETATLCGFARDALEQVYVYLQNQYSYDGVPYSTTDSSGNLQTGLYMAGDNTNYLFAASLEEFTNFEDIPQNNCPSVMTSSSPCGLTFSNAPTNNNNPSGSSFWSTLFDSTYQYETGWAPATAIMWRAVLDAWTDGSSSATVANGLTNLGFQNAANKIVLTQTEYAAKVTTTTANPESAGLTPFSATAVCFLDTNIDRSFSHQPWCYNGSYNSIDYGESGDLIEYSSNYNNNQCMAFRGSSTILSKTNDPGFYGVDYQYDSQLDPSTGNPAGFCPAGSWVDGLVPSWIVSVPEGTLSLGGYFWPAIDVSSPICGTNLSYSLQPAIARAAINFLGIPTMCGTDFDLYYSEIAPRNPYQQIVFTSAAVSGAGSTSAELGPITIQMQDTSTGTAQPLTATSAVTVSLASTSLTGVFALTAGGATISSVTIPAGSSSATFYYGDTTTGTPQISADPGTMVPGTQIETITSGSTSSQAMVGSTQRAGSGKANGTVQIRAQFGLSNPVQLQKATLTITHLLNEDLGAGELVHQGDGTEVSLPIVLAALPNSTADDAVYATASGVTPRIRAEVIDPKAQGRIQVLVDLAQIYSPIACSGNPSATRLHTQMTANDGTNPPAVFDVDLDWQCHAHGAYLTAASNTIAGSGTIAAQTAATSGAAGQAVAAGSSVLANTGSAAINVSSVTVNVSKPALFSALALTPAGGTTVSQPASGATVFNFDPAITVGAGQSENFSLEGTIGRQAAMLKVNRAYALTASGSLGGLRLGMVLGLIGFGAVLIPAAGRRNRILLILIGVLAVAASMPACGSSGSAQPSSTQSLAGGSVNAAGVPIGGLPATLSVVTQR